MSGNARIGIDLGGTKIAGIFLQPDGAPAARERLESPKGDYRKTIDSVCDLVMSLQEKGGSEASVGIGIPGSVSPATGLIQNANSTWLNAQPLKRDLETSLGRPVRLANDANCFALSEAADGAGREAASVFGVILGTGCGGGLILKGHIINGPRSIGGEWGHNPLPWSEQDELPGPQCWCGRRGCVESWVSGPGMAADHARAFSETFSAEEIAKRAGDGCPRANKTLELHASRLARGLAGVLNIFDPGCIVLGGGLSNMDHLYGQLPGLMAPYIFSDTTAVEIYPPVHGADSGVRGAAWLWGGPD